MNRTVCLCSCNGSIDSNGSVCCNGSIGYFSFIGCSGIIDMEPSIFMVPSGINNGVIKPLVPFTDIQSRHIAQTSLTVIKIINILHPIKIIPIVKTHCFQTPKGSPDDSETGLRIRTGPVPEHQACLWDECSTL